MQSKHGRDFPSGPVVNNPSCNAADVDSVPGQEAKTPHASEQLSPQATTSEPAPQLGSPGATREERAFETQWRTRRLHLRPIAAR